MSIKQKYSILQKSFYLNDTITVAKNLLGKIIVKNTSHFCLKAKIVETEAYLGYEDPACHAYRKLTKRNKPMFEKGGISYVYFIYGNYYCFNVVTEDKGVGAAVLLRAVEPIDGIEYMRQNRNYPDKDCDLSNGPAKFCMAFGINKFDNELDLSNSSIVIKSNKNQKPLTISVTKRIGIKEGIELPYRFFLKDNPYITKHKFNNEILNEIKL